MGIDLLKPRNALTMNTAPTKPKQTVFAPVGEHKPLVEGVSRNPPYLNGEAVRRVEEPKPVEAKGLEHGGVVLVGDVWEFDFGPDRVGGVWNAVANGTDVALENRYGRRFDELNRSWVLANIAHATLISRATPKPERKIEPGAKVRVVGEGCLKGRVGTVTRRHHGKWICDLTTGGEYVLLESDLELVEG